MFQFETRKETERNTRKSWTTNRKRRLEDENADAD